MRRRRIELRPDQDGLLDDVVVNDVKMFRLERMSDNTWWACCYLDDGGHDRVDFWFRYTRKLGLTAAVTDIDGGFDEGVEQTPHGWMDKQNPKSKTQGETDTQ